MFENMEREGKTKEFMDNAMKSQIVLPQGSKTPRAGNEDRLFGSDFGPFDNLA